MRERTALGTLSTSEDLLIEIDPVKLVTVRPSTHAAVNGGGGSGGHGGGGSGGGGTRVE